MADQIIMLTSKQIFKQGYYAFFVFNHGDYQL